jgi:hypothetical protein
MASTAPAPETKRCPGFAPGGQPPHELAATRENFASNAANRGGLATRCKSCGGAYGKAWSEAKKRGEKFSVRANVPLVVALAGEPEDPITAANLDALEALTQPEAPAITPGQLATLHVKVPSTPQYADELAMRTGRGKVPGYTIEQVGGLIYALPTSSAAVASEEGQAALELINSARATERRKRDADRKRAERAAKKQATATA